MKNFILTLLLAFGVFAGVRANTAAVEFYANDVQIEQAFAAAEYVGADVTASAIEAAVNAVSQDVSGGAKFMPAGDDQIVAALLAFFLGGLAIHRVYLGSTPLMILWYLITCYGIFGIVPFIDFIMILIKGVDSFVDSNKYFSW